MSFFGKVKNFLTGAAVKVSAFFVKVFGSDAAHKFADGAVALLKTQLGRLAMDAVEGIAVSNPYMSSAEKRDAAFAKIAADAKQAGLVDIPSSLINLLIEIAVSAIVKQNFYPAGPIA